MNYYNLYYKESKLNNRPVNKDDLGNIMKAKNICKRNMITGKLENIPTNRIHIVKTIII